VVCQVSDELSLHEDDARELVLASSDPRSLPDDPYFFPTGLGPCSSSKRLFFYRRHTSVAAVEELLAALQDERVTGTAGKQNFLVGLVADTLVSEGCTDTRRLVCTTLIVNCAAHHA